MQTGGPYVHSIYLACAATTIVYFLICGTLAAINPEFGSMAQTEPQEGASVILFASLAALALFNALFVAALFLRLVGQVRQLSERDPLTELLNRRAFHKGADAAVERQLRLGEPYSLVLLDLDYFKQINDRYGHPAGDAALVATARVLEDMTRNLDLVCRWGGEEFAVLLTGCAADEAVDTAERLRCAVADLVVLHGDVPIPLTTSIGVATSEQSQSFDELLALCDDALLQAKAAGRNRWIMARFGPAKAPRESVAVHQQCVA